MVCSLPLVARSLPFAACSLQRAACGLQLEACSLHLAAIPQNPFLRTIWLILGQAEYFRTRLRRNTIIIVPIALIGNIHYRRLCIVISQNPFLRTIWLILGQAGYFCTRLRRNTSISMPIALIGNIHRNTFTFGTTPAALAGNIHFINIPTALAGNIHPIAGWRPWMSILRLPFALLSFSMALSNTFAWIRAVAQLVLQQLQHVLELRVCLIRQIFFPSGGVGDVDCLAGD